jgi:hypothetical protein
MSTTRTCAVPKDKVKDLKDDEDEEDEAPVSPMNPVRKRKIGRSKKKEDDDVAIIIIMSTTNTRMDSVRAHSLSYKRWPQERLFR